MKFSTTIRRIILSSLLALSAVTGISCSSTSSPTDDDGNMIAMRGNRFAPATLTIARGETVTWINDDDELHTATSAFGDGGWSTGVMTAGATRSITFYSPGTFDYYCAYHVDMGMRGTIIVQ